MPEPDTRVVAGVSPIHGSGLFAARDLVAGEFLAVYRGEIVSKTESKRRREAVPEGAPVYLVALDDERDIDGDIPDNPAKHANHGCDANAELILGPAGELELAALRDIPAGTEILFDYGFGLAESLAHPCRCGSPECVGRILAAPLRPLLKKHLRFARPR